MFIVTWHALLEEGNTWVELEANGILDDSYYYYYLFWLKWGDLMKVGGFFDDRLLLV